MMGTSNAVISCAENPWYGEKGGGEQREYIPEQRTEPGFPASRLRRVRPMQRGGPVGDFKRPPPARERRTRGGTANFRPLSEQSRRVVRGNGRGVFMF